jgi:hypothetical protein
MKDYDDFRQEAEIAAWELERSGQKFESPEKRIEYIENETRMISIRFFQQAMNRSRLLRENITPVSEKTNHAIAHILREYLLDLVCKSEKVCEAIKKHGAHDALTTAQLKRLTHTELGVLMAPQLLSYKSYEMTNKEIALKLYKSEKENDIRKISRAMKIAMDILDNVCIIDTDLSFTDYL